MTYPGSAGGWPPPAYPDAAGATAAMSGLRLSGAQAAPARPAAPTVQGVAVAAPKVQAPRVQEVVVTGCAAGVGMGLDERQTISSLTPGGPAATCGLELGDTVLSVDGVTIAGKTVDGKPLTVRDVLRPQDRHVFGVEKGKKGADEHDLQVWLLTPEDDLKAATSELRFFRQLLGA